MDSILNLHVFLRIPKKKKTANTYRKDNWLHKTLFYTCNCKPLASVQIMALFRHGIHIIYTAKWRPIKKTNRIRGVGVYPIGVDSVVSVSVSVTFSFLYNISQNSGRNLTKLTETFLLADQKQSH